MSNKRKLALFMLPFVAVGLYLVVRNARASQVQAVDPMVITYNGDAPPDPMFTVTNMLPGDAEERVFNVANSSANSIQVQMAAVKTHEEKDFAEILYIEITLVGPETVVFSGKLDDFLNNPPIDLGIFTPGEDKDFRVKVKFPNDSGNEYQNAVVIFNIKWFAKGHHEKPPIPLPDECKAFEGKINNLIEGDSGANYLLGTSKNDLIIGHGGNDKLFGRGGHDCIVAGDGNDFVLGGSGNDIILGGSGNDNIDSQSGFDLIYGGDGDDRLSSGSDNDKVLAGSGNDEVYLGSGKDYLEAGTGNDTVRAGSENDWVKGEGGNDNIQGESGSDTLDGGPDTDTLNGGSGTDTCTTGETISFCEL